MFARNRWARVADGAQLDQLEASYNELDADEQAAEDLWVASVSDADLAARLGADGETGSTPDLQIPEVSEGKASDPLPQSVPSAPGEAEESDPPQ